MLDVDAMIGRDIYIRAYLLTCDALLMKEPRKIQRLIEYQGSLIYISTVN